MEMLSAEQFLQQQSGGTWAELFDRSSLINSHEWLTVLLWLLAFRLLGIIFLPLTNLMFGRLRDKGYGVSAFFGLLLTGYVVWLGAFFGFDYTRGHICLVLVCFAFLNAIIAFFRRRTFFTEIKNARKAILTSEIVFLSCFFFFLLIRIGNPDLWHPYKGGERPMDFSYFNAILKSTSFPPYDPWFAGGYLNYYYYGIYLSGLFVKLLGVVPSVAFNLNLATWYAFLGIAAFSLGRYLFEEIRKQDGTAAGIFTVLAVQFFGNLGTVVQIKNELIELGGMERGFPSFWMGIAKLFSGEHLHMYKGDWYWIPSRAIPDTSITEFPFFTFLYGDPHAHLFALPITMMVLLWLAIMVSRLTGRRTSSSGDAASLACGGLLIGTLIPTNTWDMPTYLCLSAAVIGFTAWKNGVFCSAEKSGKARLFTAILAVAELAAVSLVLFIPYFRTNYRENILSYWDETHTPISSYLMHWGLFLFMIASRYVVLTKEWLADTPLTVGRDFLRKYRTILTAMILLAFVILLGMQALGISIIWIALPMMIWSLLLLVRPKAELLDRLLCFVVGVALFATLLVEMIHLEGDYGRMNTVFKFYNQVWIMLSVCAAYSFAMVSSRLVQPLQIHWSLWRINVVLLIFGAFLYPVFAGTDKITDRMSDSAPHTLDGMKYMETSWYWQDGFNMDLSQDYDAIIWMQENVEGSPVIVEANATEYKFGSRYTMYTGLPGVVGWNYHQRQQRGPISEEVWTRVNEIAHFYNTTNIEAARQFLEKYNVKYIIVGQMERGLYGDAGIMKFEENDGVLWNCVYDHAETKIYKVVDK